MHVCLMGDNRIGATSADYDCGEDQFDFEFPKDFDFGHQDDYKIVDGELIYDPIRIDNIQVSAE